jgi:hypothetical protein
VQGFVRTTLLPAQHGERPAPTTFPGGWGEDLHAISIELPAAGVLTIERAQLNHESIVFQRWPLAVSFARPMDGERFRKVQDRARFIVKNYLLRRPLRAGRVLWCVDNFSPGNWYHWLTEVLPRLFVGRDLFDSVDCVAFPNYYRRDRFVEETLGLLPKLPPVLWIPPTRRVIASPLVLVERTAPAWDYRSDVMRGLSDLLAERAAVDVKDEAPSLRIYVTRDGAGWRRAANERQVRDALDKRGFVTVSPGDLSVVEQIRLFRKASCVVGLHGAGLTNMVFCQPGATVVEIAARDPHPHWECYYRLACAMGHRYLLCQADLTVPGDASFERRRDADLRVDLRNLLQAVDQAT